MGYSDAKVQKEWQRQYLQRVVLKRRREWLKEHGPCAVCGSWDRLEVDHIKKTTKVSHNVWSWSTKRRLEELTKCQVLCEDCHQEKTTAERVKPQHGTQSCYTTGCRCDKCRSGHANCMAKWRQK